jgi:competence protein ComEA
MLLLAGAVLSYGIRMATQHVARVDDAAIARLPDMRIDINSASSSELSLLPGLGERLAQRIVEDRDSRGAFTRVDDLQRVPGIGDSIIERLRPFAVCDQPQRETSAPHAP